MTARRTWNEGFSLNGVGVHTGVEARVLVLPAEPGAGRRFVRVDLPGRPVIEARVASVVPSLLSTTLAAPGGARVQTVEHLLAALHGAGIDDATIEISGPEVPILDGSAWPWFEGLVLHGSSPPPRGAPERTDVVAVHPGADPRCASPSSAHIEAPRDGGLGGQAPWFTSSSSAHVEAPRDGGLGGLDPGHPSGALCVRSGEAFVAVMPSEELCLTYGIVFPAPIGVQWRTFRAGRDDFGEALAPARTFALQAEVEALQARGGLRGGHAGCAIVAGPGGWVNPPLRFDDEPVRHKLLDLVGDLALLGRVPAMRLVAYKAGHALHVEAARLIERSLLR